MTLVDNGQISRTDIESKLREIRGEVDTATERPRASGWSSPSRWWWRGRRRLPPGRRRGSKLSTVVEIRRVG